MRAKTWLPLAVVWFATSVVFAAPASAMPLAVLMPRVQPSSFDEFERTAAPSGGARASDLEPARAPAAAPAAPSAADTAKEAAPHEPSLSPPGTGGLDVPRPRWKSIVPGSLK